MNVITSKGTGNIEYTLCLKGTLGRPVEDGSTVTSSKGETAIVIGGKAPHKPGSTGKVYVETEHGVREYYPGVYGLVWVDLEALGDYLSEKRGRDEGWL